MTGPDHRRWIASTKRELRAAHDVERAFADARDAMRAEADAVRETHARGEAVVPEIRYADVVHAVGQEHGGDEYASVIYVGASPRCRKNETYARRQAPCFLAGRSAPDFAAEDHEVNFEGRATIDDLTPLGRAQMALG